MTRLIKDADRKVFLILDNLRVYHSKKVAKWLEKCKEGVEIFYRPPYSPERNPDGYLSGNLKNKVHFGTSIQNRGDFGKRIQSLMRTLAKRLAHPRSYVNHQKDAYTAQT